MSANGKSTELKREEFRKLLERSGVLEMVINAFGNMYKAELQDPKEAVLFFRKELNLTSSEEMVIANAKIKELEAKILLYQSLNQPDRKSA